VSFHIARIAGVFGSSFVSLCELYEETRIQPNSSAAGRKRSIGARALPRASSRYRTGQARDAE
jgi:hypothetical protein